MSLSSHFFSFLLMAVTALTVTARERLIVLNEGMWQADNGRITYFEDGKIVSNQWFRDRNGHKLGDTPNDIILVNDSLIAIAVNWSNIVQFIRYDGKAVAESEGVPNNRKLASDGKFVYVTSYGHECKVDGRMVEFTKGFVAKIDVSKFKVVAACEVGYEPEGIAFYDGHLFVANTGGYAFNENHDYETTVSVIDAATMTVSRTVDTGQINLYGKMSQSGKYLCINSPGDYYEVPAATVILDCEAVLAGKNDEYCQALLPFASTYSATASDGNFYSVGSPYSYITGGYGLSLYIINPSEAIESGGSSGYYETGWPGTVQSDIGAMAMPYGIYVNPYSGYIYATDASSFSDAGVLYQWSPEGVRLGKFKTYINPGHFLALPDESGAGVDAVIVGTDADSPVYNIRGMRVSNLKPGEIYIRNGRKFIK